MGGLRFDSMADMPAGMRDLYAKKVLGSSTPPVSRADSPLSAEGAKRKTAKYQNQKAERGRIHFDSQKEARRYDELLLMLRAGEIRDLRLQPQFTIQESYVTETGERVRAIRYTADFSYIREVSGEKIVEDVKSGPTRTKEYLRNRKFMRSMYGIDVREV